MCARFDTELRPHLMRLAISQLQESGIEPDVWKIEGLDRREDCEAVVEQCRIAGRDHVACVVLGRGADTAAVDHWLQTASGVPGYQGFAIGRSIWWNPLKAFVDGSLDRERRRARDRRELRPVHPGLSRASGLSETPLRRRRSGRACGGSGGRRCRR